ncbi:MAG: hypothetical protein JWO32_1195, partial [Bacteroidetes bacterium]|nr:hypothetical protein [Bacteroidota bacterium]
MKHLLKIAFLFIAAGILFTSCKTMSVTKRHYNKGYYVSHSAKKSRVNSTEAEKQSLATAEPLVAKVTKLPETPAKDKELLASNIGASSSVIKSREQ